MVMRKGELKTIRELVEVSVLTHVNTEFWNQVSFWPIPSPSPEDSETLDETFLEVPLL